MIFPFQIRFRKTFNVLSNTNNKELLDLIRKNVIAGETSIKEIENDQNEFRYELNSWKLSSTNNYVGVKNGIFIITEKGNSKTLIYTFIIGGGYIPALFFAGLFLLSLVIPYFVDGISPTWSKVLLYFYAFIGFCLLMWLAALFQQNRLFRRIVRKMELLP
jgi:hypothetical protein